VAGGNPSDADDRVVLVAASAGDLRVWSSPQDGARLIETLSPTRQTSGQVVCVVAQELGDWLEVALPTAPTGRTGWVERDDVELSRHSFRIEVSRSEHTLTLHAGEVETLTAPVAFGTADGPPAGKTLFIKDLVEPPAVPGGPYVRYAYGLAGAANDLAAFQAGSGVVAIHGAADPSTLGRDVPTGSIAVDPGIMTRMVEGIGLPLGTPVEVVE
jgi:hypothetical protein